MPRKRKARIETFKTRNGQQGYRIRGGNGEIMVSSETVSRALRGAKALNALPWPLPIVRR